MTRERGASQGHISDAGIVMGQAAEREAATIASDALIRALLIYGWKNDGLPGLSGWEFRALAREYGVRP